MSLPLSLLLEIGRPFSFGYEPWLLIFWMSSKLVCLWDNNKMPLIFSGSSILLVLSNMVLYLCLTLLAIIGSAWASWVYQVLHHDLYLSYLQIRPSPALTSDYLGPSWIARTTWFTLGLLISVPSRTTWTTPDPWHRSHLGSLGSLRLSMTFYELPHLDLVVSLPCHSLNLTCTRLALRDPVSTPLGSSGTAPIHSPGSCTLSSLGLVLSLSMTLLVFGHCLSIVLYKPGLCSTSSSVQISHHVLVSSSRHHVTVFIPMPSKFHLSSQLLHSIFLSVPPKSTLDLELRDRTILVVIPGRRPLLGSHSKSTQLLPERIEYQPPLSSLNPRSSLGLTRCCLVSTSALHPPLIGSKRLHKFRTTRLGTRVQHTSWSRRPTMTKSCSRSSGSRQLLLSLSPFPLQGFPSRSPH